MLNPSQQLIFTLDLTADQTKQTPKLAKQLQKWDNIGRELHNSHLLIIRHKNLDGNCDFFPVFVNNPRSLEEQKVFWMTQSQDLWQLSRIIML